MVKFDRTRHEYRERRKSFAANAGIANLWEVVDHWPLYSGTQTLARFLANADLLRSTLSVPGHIAEFGSWKGANLMLLAKVLRIFDPLSEKEVHSFDSFEGLTQFSEHDPHDNDMGGQQTGQYKGDLDQLRQLIDVEAMDDEIEFHQGYIEETLPKLLEARPSMSFSFVYCDTDLYESTRVILSSLHDRLVPGGLFVLDEWNLDEHAGEGIAANEFIAAHPGLYDIESVPNTRQPTLALRKRS